MRFLIIFLNNSNMTFFLNLIESFERKNWMDFFFFLKKIFVDVMRNFSLTQSNENGGKKLIDIWVLRESTVFSTFFHRCEVKWTKWDHLIPNKDDFESIYIFWMKSFHLDKTKIYIMSCYSQKQSPIHENNCLLYDNCLTN